jgi:hypothetical protein
MTPAQELYMLRIQFATVEREGLDRAHQLLDTTAAKRDMPPVSEGFKTAARNAALLELDATNRALEPVRVSLAALGDRPDWQ